VRGPGGGYSLARKPEEISIADVIIAVDEPLDATQCGGKENCHGEDGEGRCMTHDLWAALNTRMVEFLDSVNLKIMVDQNLAQGVTIEQVAVVRKPVSAMPANKPVKVRAPNSVFNLAQTMT
jgi:Rrf2 family iron-sulfur cluster assembly transcriptional regulator